MSKNANAKVILNQLNLIRMSAKDSPIASEQFDRVCRSLGVLVDSMDLANSQISEDQKLAKYYILQGFQIVTDVMMGVL